MEIARIESSNPTRQDLSAKWHDGRGLAATGGAMVTRSSGGRKARSIRIWRVTEETQGI